MAAVAASGGANLTDLCPASPATDVMVLHGTADPIAPTTGSEVPFATPNGLAIDDVVATNAARAGCSPIPATEQLFGDVVVDRYQGCDGAGRVEYWRLLGAGHTWAGTTAPLGPPWALPLVPALLLPLSKATTSRVSAALMTNAMPLLSLA